MAGQKPQLASEEKVLVGRAGAPGSPGLRQDHQPDRLARRLPGGIHRARTDPRGDTAVQAGDQLTVLCGDSEVAQVRRAMEHWCETAAAPKVENWTGASGSVYLQERRREPVLFRELVGNI